MKKIIKQWGNSLVIVFNSEDIKIYDLKVDNLIDIELVKIKRLPKSKNIQSDIKKELNPDPKKSGDALL